MPSKPFDPKATLFQIRDNVTLALSFVEGFDYQRFCGDRRTVYAVTRALEIISEASRRLPLAIKQRRPELPWADMAGAGSVYRHDYEDVRERRLWSTLQKDLARFSPSSSRNCATSGSCRDLRLHPRLERRPRPHRPVGRVESGGMGTDYPRRVHGRRCRPTAASKAVA